MTGGGYGAVDETDDKFVIGGFTGMKRHNSMRTMGILTRAIKGFKTKGEAKSAPLELKSGAAWHTKGSGGRKSPAGELILKFNVVLKKTAAFRLTLWAMCKPGEGKLDLEISDHDIWCWSNFESVQGKHIDYPSTRSTFVASVSPPPTGHQRPVLKQIKHSTLSIHADENGDRWVLWDIPGAKEAGGKAIEGKEFSMMTQIGLISRDKLQDLWTEKGAWAIKKGKVVFRFELSCTESSGETKKTTVDREVDLKDIMWKGTESAEKKGEWKAAADKFWHNEDVKEMEEIESLGISLYMKPAPLEDATERECIINQSRFRNTDNANSLIAAGRMTWENHFQQQSAPYIRIPCNAQRGFHNTNPHLLTFFLQLVWGVPPPELLITVTGGARDFQLSTEQKDSLLKGLTRAAKTMNGWFIDGGTDAGIMKYMGEARVQFASQVPLIGVAPWGVVAGRHRLIRQAAQEDESVFAEDQLVKYQQAVKEFNKVHEDMEIHVQESQSQKKLHKTGLDHNHSHFILVHDGTTRFSNEVGLRTSLEACIAEGTTKARGIALELQRQGLGWNGMNQRTIDALGDGGHGPIPSVCVCVQGGPGTIKTVEEAAHKGTPVLLVKGSGKAADLIADMVLLHGDRAAKTGKKKLKMVAKSEETQQSKKLGKVLQAVLKWMVQSSVEEDFDTAKLTKEPEGSEQALPKLLGMLKAFQASSTKKGRDESEVAEWVEFEKRVIDEFRNVLVIYGLLETSGGSGNQRKSSEGVAKFLQQLISISMSQRCHVYDLDDDSPSQKDLNHALLQCIRYGSSEKRLPKEKKILLAVKWNQKDVLKAILEESKEDLHTLIPDLNKSLRLALRKDYSELVDILFDHGATMDEYEINQNVIKKEWWVGQDSRQQKGPSGARSKTSFREKRSDSSAFTRAVQVDLQMEKAGSEKIKHDAGINELVRSLRNARNFKLLMDVGKEDQLCQHSSMLRQEVKYHLDKSSSLPGKMFQECRSRTHKIRETMLNQDPENEDVKQTMEQQTLKLTVQAHKNLLVVDRLYRNLLGENFKFKTGMMGPEWDLFLWSVLMNRQKLAVLLWEKSSRPVVTALTAAILYKAMAKSPLVMSQIKESMLQNAQQFEEIAITVQNAARDENYISAIQALERPIGVWSGLTCYDLAVKGDCREFIRQCCGIASANRWTGDLVPVDNWMDLTVEISVGICIFSCGLLAPLVLKFENPPPCEQLRAPAQRRAIPEGYPYPFKNREMMHRYYEMKGHFDANPDRKGGFFLWQWIGLVEDERDMVRWFQTMQKIQKNPSMVSKLSDDETRRLWQPTFTFWERWLCFIYAPVTLFVFQAILYTAVVLIFTNELVVHIEQADVLSWQEVFVFCWVTCSTVHELVQLRNAGVEYILDFWNTVDLLTISIFWPAFYFRMECIDPVSCWNKFGWDNVPLVDPIVPTRENLLDPVQSELIQAQEALISDQLFKSQKGYRLRPLGRQLYGLSCLFFWLRILRIFSVQQNLGPLVRAIGKMIFDFTNFIFVWVVVTMAFAVAIHAGNTQTDCLEPDDPQAIHGYCTSWWWFSRLYFQSFGELFLDELNDTVSIVLLMAALLFLQLVLMNTVFVAIITSTFEEVYQQSYQTYLFDMYDLTNEYISFSSATPIPFNLLSVMYHLYTALAWRGTVAQMQKDEKDGGLRPSSSRTLHTRLRNPRFCHLDVLPEEIRRELLKARSEHNSPRREAVEPAHRVLPSEVRQVESLMERAKLIYLDETRSVDRKKELKKKRVTFISKQVKLLEKQVQKLSTKTDEVNALQDKKINKLLKHLDVGTSTRSGAVQSPNDQRPESSFLNDSGNLQSQVTTMGHS